MHILIFLNDKADFLFVHHDLGNFPAFNGRVSENKAADVAVIIHPEIEKNTKPEQQGAADAPASGCPCSIHITCKYRLSFFQLQAFKGFLDDVLSHFKS